MVKQVTRKTFTIRESGRSTDYIAPSFGFGCLLDCSYCYMKRHTNDKSLKYAKNYLDVLTAVNDHVMWLDPKWPNQTDPEYYTYDISCNEDFALHSKYYEWERIFEFFRDHDRAKASLATKIIPVNFLNFDPQKKVRIRFSLMPQEYSTLLEPGTPPIIDRIKAIDAFIDAGYEVHINFSPIIMSDGWLDKYEELFNYVQDYVQYKDEVLAECIFLTHNVKKHQDNLEAGRPGEHLLWDPRVQENKTSQYGGNNIRYKHTTKAEYIKDFTELHNKIIPWNTIRYIF
jgi:spore photoproduct lyase